MTTQISVDDYDRDKRITNLERQVLILSGKIAARDTALRYLLKEMVVRASEAAICFVDDHPEMLADIDAKVLSAIIEADQEKVPS